MTTFPRSPRFLKGGLVLIDPDTSIAQRIIVLRYNPDSLSRTLQASGDSKDRSQALRLTGPPVETINLEAEINVTDQLRPSDGEIALIQVPHSRRSRLSRCPGCWWLDRSSTRRGPITERVFHGFLRFGPGLCGYVTKASF